MTLKVSKGRKTQLKNNNNVDRFGGLVPGSGTLLGRCLFETLSECSAKRLVVQEVKKNKTKNKMVLLPRNSVVRLTDRLDMTIVVDWDAKP